jgi:Ni/Co efflux regulator RcnB
MKALLIIAVALATVATAPAFAAQYRGSQGYERNDNVNRGDFQTSGARWKTNHKHHRAHQTAKGPHEKRLPRFGGAFRFGRA